MLNHSSAEKHNDSNQGLQCTVIFANRIGSKPFLSALTLSLFMFNKALKGARGDNFQL